MVRFRMFKIHVEQFAILAESITFDKVESAATLETRLSFKAAKDNKIAPIIRFSFVKERQPILLIEVCCEFDIHPNDWKGMLNGDVLTVSKETLEYLAAQTVGVTRGILYCKTEGTPFNVFILPPINIASMIDGDLTINFQE